MRYETSIGGDDVEDYKIYRHVLCIDLKSFFASVECVLRGLDPFETPLIVADAERGGGSVVLAVTPFLKQQGFKSRGRLHEMPTVDHMIIATPRMREYLRFSKKIVEIYLDYVAPEDLHIYSIDEAFLDVTAYLNYYHMTTQQLAHTIKDAILSRTAIPATVGIGDNLLLSKLALDLYSKTAEDGIAEMRYGDVPGMLWPVRPLSAMWGIGPRMEKRLNQLNIFSVHDLAHSSRKTLKRLFGIMGEELYFHAHGIDMTIISDKSGTRMPMKSVGLGQTLYQDYDAHSIEQILLEMVDETAEKLRFVRKRAKTLHLGIGYSKSVGGGFSRQCSVDEPTDDVETLLEMTLTLFVKHYDGSPIRQVFLRATGLHEHIGMFQLSFFENVERKVRRANLWTAIDGVRQRFGKQSVVRLSSLLEEGTYLERTTLVGGHRG
ncbi:MAG: damage repair protein [Acholeplasmatales bacterium]|nr:MAG: damage repair protein [Acholeplasmatales bacterium]